MALGGRVLGGIMFLGAAALAVAVVIAAPRMLKTARPFVREGLKRGMKLYEKARASAAGFVEDVEDLVAEVKADVTAKTPESPTAVSDEPSASR